MQTKQLKKKLRENFYGLVQQKRMTLAEWNKLNNFIEKALKETYKAGKDAEKMKDVKVVSVQFLKSLKDPNDKEAQWLLEEVRKKAVKDTCKALKVKRLGYDNKGGYKLFMEGYNLAITRQEEKEKKLCK